MIKVRQSFSPPARPRLGVLQSSPRSNRSLMFVCQNSGAMNILLVEDDRKLARALGTLLEEDGHSVTSAHDGERGLELGMENPYDAVILDVMLPRLDGFEVCRALRANRIEVPILMLTARTVVEDRVRGL